MLGRCRAELLPVSSMPVCGCKGTKTKAVSTWRFMVLLNQCNKPLKCPDMVINKYRYKYSYNGLISTMNLQAARGAGALNPCDDPS